MKSQRRITLVVIVVALSIGLVGAASATTGGNASTGPSTVIVKRGKPGKRGPKGPRGATGPAGTNGKIGPTGPQGPPSQGVVAYGVLVPEFGEGLPAHFDLQHSQNLALGQPPEVSAPGKWCIVAKGVNTSRAAVVVSPVEESEPSIEEAEVPVVEWVPGAPDCNAFELEVQTWLFQPPKEGTGPRVFSNLVGFSMVVEGG